MNPARSAYDEYCNSRNWKSFRGEPLPQWDDVQPDIKHGWAVAAAAVMRECALHLSESKDIMCLGEGVSFLEDAAEKVVNENPKP